MFSISSSSRSPGWLAVLPGSGTLTLAHVVRHPGRRAEVVHLEEFALVGDEATALKRLASAFRLKSSRCTTLMGDGGMSSLLAVSDFAPKPPVPAVALAAPNLAGPPADPGPSTIGGGRGQAVATVIGAVAGGLAGSAVEEGATRTPGVEVTVRLDNGQFLAVVQADEGEGFRPGERVRILRDGGTTRVTR